jgi:hypothetical protein
LIETFHLPLREIEDKFTRSELVIMAWRSQEQHFNLQKDMPSKKKGSRKQVYGPDDIGPEGMPDEFFAKTDIYDVKGKLIAKEGELYLSQVKGEEARRYFEQRLGIPMPPGISKIRDESDISNQIRSAYNIRR